MTTKPINEKTYVYCHDCEKLLFKGPIDDANGIRCGEHTITCGKIGYFNKAYPDIDTSAWEQLHPDKGHLLHVRGNICFPQRMSDNEISVIPHCCNNLGVMGAGVAKSLKEKWPEGVQPYFANATINLILGDAFFGLTDSDGKIIIANMIGQDGTVNNNNPKPVKYWALVDAMRKTLAHATGYAFRSDNIVFHCPKFGSDLAGGDFRLITELIKEIWVDAGFDVLIYEFEMDETMWGPIEDDS